MYFVHQITIATSNLCYEKLRDHKTDIPFRRNFDNWVAKVAARTASSEMSP